MWFLAIALVYDKLIFVVQGECVAQALSNPVWKIRFESPALEQIPFGCNHFACTAHEAC
jgi:hypothetical protein